MTFSLTREPCTVYKRCISGVETSSNFIAMCCRMVMSTLSAQVKSNGSKCILIANSASSALFWYPVALYTRPSGHSKPISQAMPC